MYFENPGGGGLLSLSQIMYLEKPRRVHSLLNTNLYIVYFENQGVLLSLSDNVFRKANEGAYSYSSLNTNL